MRDLNHRLFMAGARLSLSGAYDTIKVNAAGRDINIRS